MKENLQLLFKWRGVEIKYIPTEENGQKEVIKLNKVFALVDGAPLAIVGFSFEFLAFNALKVIPIIELSPKTYEKRKNVVEVLESREWVVLKTNPKDYVKKI